MDILGYTNPCRVPGYHVARRTQVRNIDFGPETVVGSQGKAPKAPLEYLMGAVY
jgi:hypothetical protein